MEKKSPFNLTQITQTVKRRDLIVIDGDRARHRAVFIFLLLLGAVFLFYSDFEYSSSSPNGKSNFFSFLPFSEDAEKYMDKQLQDGMKSSELSSLRTKLENKKWAPPIEGERIGLFQREKPQLYKGYTRETPEDHASQVYEDIGHGESYEHRDHPGEKIEALLARRKFVEQYDKAQRQEYVRQFLKNAEEQGYLVQLNDQLEVVRVQEIPTDRPLRLPQGYKEPLKDSRPSPFDSGYSGSR